MTMSISVLCFVSLLLTVLLLPAKSQTCSGMSQYEPCSSIKTCSCLRLLHSIDDGICARQKLECTQLMPCNTTNNECPTRDHVCVRHPRCHNEPVCYPLSMANEKVCPPIAKRSPHKRASTVIINETSRWKQNGTLVAAGNGPGSGMNQLFMPGTLYVDHGQNIYISDSFNHRIVKWRPGAKRGRVVAGGNGEGNGTRQLRYPKSLVVDKRNNDFIICDRMNKRVVRWSRRYGQIIETIASNLSCMGLAIDDDGYIYVAHNVEHEVRRYGRESSGIIVAGGNGGGNRTDQFMHPSSVYVDRNNSVYVADWDNGRVMKWMRGATEGIVVAGGTGKGYLLSQLSNPIGIIVDEMGFLYVIDSTNARIMRWAPGAKEGSLIVGASSEEERSNEFLGSGALAMDRKGNLYITEWFDHGVRRFDLIR